MQYHALETHIPTLIPTLYQRECMHIYISADITSALISHALLNQTKKILEPTCNAVLRRIHVVVIPGILQAIKEAAFNY